LESARIWELRNWSLRSIIVGVDVAILIELWMNRCGLGGSDVDANVWGRRDRLGHLARDQ
jgi:hypothetical protein